MENEEVVIKVELEAKEAEVEIVGIVQALKTFGASMTAIGVGIVKTFGIATASVKSMETSLYMASASMVLMSQEMNNLVALQGQVQPGGWQEGLGTAAEWFNANVVQPIAGFFTAAFDQIAAKLGEGLALVRSVFNGISQFLSDAFAADWTEQFGAFGNVLNAFFTNVKSIWNAVKSIFGGIVDFVKNVFAGDWGAAWDSIVNVFKGIWDVLISIVKAPVNGIIGLINGLIQGVVDGINLVIRALNSIRVKIPDWVPLVGGQAFGFNLKQLKAPQIPYLAQGAVLPANKPFLAVVGDQKHGTNVEAPLSTIQEAVAVVMGDQIAAMMAGFEALLKEQRATRATIEGIEIGDTVIGRAAERYGRKMAVARGVY